jgi:integrase/recombinase XerD
MIVQCREQATGERRAYRLWGEQQEITWPSRFLDQLQAIGRSMHTIRSYAMSLAHFLSWWSEHGGGDVRVCPQQPWPEAVLVEYVLWQGKQPRRPAPATMQSRLAAVRQWMAFQFELITPSPGRRTSQFRPGGKVSIQRLSRVSVKIPRRQTVPLSQDEVSRFWTSFRSLRDLAVVGLMLLNGLRAGEVLGLDREDVLLGQGELRVRGKGRRLRLLPLAPETIQLLENYLRSERPTNSCSHLFVCLKGKARGKPMTEAGLRSLFRYHRKRSGIEKAHPHRFRHTFAGDMIRAGVSLPALMRLMGHSDIQTTMVYLALTPEDVYREYARAVTRRLPPSQ